MKSIISILILLSISIFEVGAQTFRTDTLNDSVQNILPAYKEGDILHVKDGIRRTDNIRSIKKGLDSIYTVKYVYSVSDNKDGYIYDRWHILDEKVRNATCVDEYGLAKAILDSTTTGYNRLSFSFVPKINREKRILFQGADAMRHTEYAFSKITIDMTRNDITISISVKEVVCFLSGGIGGIRLQDTIPISECFKQDKESYAIVRNLNEYTNRVVVNFWNFFNGGTLDLFGRARKFDAVKWSF